MADRPRLGAGIEQKWRQEIDGTGGGHPPVDHVHRNRIGVAGLPGQARQVGRQIDGVFAGATGQFQDCPRGGQNAAQHGQNWVTIARRRRGVGKIVMGVAHGRQQVKAGVTANKGKTTQLQWLRRGPAV